MKELIKLPKSNITINKETNLYINDCLIQSITYYSLNLNINVFIVNPLSGGIVK
jgi:hypothetical protein